MNPLIIEQSEETPRIHFDSAKGKLVIEGRSLPEDAVHFYEPCLSWTKQYASAPLEHTTLQFNLDYFNSSSAKQMVEIMIVLESVNEGGKSVLVEWMYEEDDELMLTRGKEIESIIDLSFEYIPLKPKSEY